MGCGFLFARRILCHSCWQCRIYIGYIRFISATYRYIEMHHVSFSNFVNTDNHIRIYSNFIHLRIITDIYSWYFVMFLLVFNFFFNVLDYVEKFSLQHFYWTQSTATQYSGKRTSPSLIPHNAILSFYYDVVFKFFLLSFCMGSILVFTNSLLSIDHLLRIFYSNISALKSILKKTKKI